MGHDKLDVSKRRFQNLPVNLTPDHTGDKALHVHSQSLSVNKIIITKRSLLQSSNTASNTLVLVHLLYVASLFEAIHGNDVHE